MICKASRLLYGIWEWKKDECMELGKQILMEEILVTIFLEGVSLKVIVFGKHHTYCSINDTTEVYFQMH